ncbi:hypothetical protein ACFSKY_03860 [Azotobacter chroococcum]|uniref:hypothetical protein n=1 Tax=Azotobacter chroococcum TaxID=353 RepID=UPI001F6008F5|nr:hypothetical protein [Azotobacter chroococcum]
MPIDLQSAIVAELIARLADVPEFGALVLEDSVLRILDAEDDGLPDDLIVVQPGQTEEVERIGQGSVRERVTLNLTAMTRRRSVRPGPARRPAGDQGRAARPQGRPDHHRRASRPPSSRKAPCRPARGGAGPLTSCRCRSPTSNRSNNPRSLP